MVSNPIHQALVLAGHSCPPRTAAGDSHALKRGFPPQAGGLTPTGSSKPLALVRSAGVPLLKRTILTLCREGVRRFVIVATHEVQRALGRDPQLRELEIVWLHVDAERAHEDGFALLQAAPHLRGEFFVVQGDRVFAPQIVRRLLQEPLDTVTVAVGRDGPKQLAAVGVQAGPRDELQALGPIAQPVGVSTGLMSASRGLVAIAQEVQALGGPLTLERVVNVAARRGLARVADVGDAEFQDLRTPAGHRESQRVLLRGLRKSVDGIIARHINRRFSLAATSLLMHLPVRPNHVTAFSLAVSLAAGVTTAMATTASTWWLVLGAVLWQLASMLDGIDGELARLKFAESKFGEWFDTLTDDIGKWAMFIGAGIAGTELTGNSIWLQLCIVAVTIQFSLSINLYRKLLKAGSGSHFALAWEVNPDAKASWAARAYKRIEFMSRRDYYVFVWLTFTVLGMFFVPVVIMFATTMVVLAHELLKPRQVREDFAVRPPAG